MEGKQQHHSHCGQWHRCRFLARFNSIYPIKKTIQWCLGSSSFFFFLIRDNKLRWVAFRMAAATFVYHSMVKSWASKTNSASSKKENAISCIVNLFLAVSAIPPLLFCWLLDILGFEIKILNHCTLHSKVHKGTPHSRCMHMTMYCRHMNFCDWACECTLVCLKVQNLKVCI